MGQNPVDNHPQQNVQNLIWQFHIDARRDYDGDRRGAMVDQSHDLVRHYAARIGCDARLETNSQFHSQGVHCGLLLECLQVIDRRYDCYDHILVLDTDVLIAPQCRDLFTDFADHDIVGVNALHNQDERLLNSGWLRDAVDVERYRENYIHGAIYLMSRKFRRWLRTHCDPMLIEQDRAIVDAADCYEDAIPDLRWPLYDQSLMSYWIASSPFNLTHLGPDFEWGPHIYHFGGPKTDQWIDEFADLYGELKTQWIHV